MLALSAFGYILWLNKLSAICDCSSWKHSFSSTQKNLKEMYILDLDLMGLKQEASMNQI